jgi:rhamnulokinase
MEPPAGREALVAIDLGAQSCRVSLLRWPQGQPRIDLIHRFSNAPVATAGGLRWQLNHIVDELQAGLRECAMTAPEGIASVGVDGWAVDYVRLDEAGGWVANPFCYRDERTRMAEEQVHQIISPERLYSLTGIQLLRINTLYQLYADQLAGVNGAWRWIHLPEFVIHLLGGRCASEYTNATHSGLVRLGGHQWCEEIFRDLGLELRAAPEIVPTGSPAGAVKGDLVSLSAFRKTQLIFPACHDTASAIAGIPAGGDDWAFISSGTWSLVGTTLNTACVSDDARALNFTNVGGVGGRICFLKNVNGMWLLQQCLEECAASGHAWSLNELLRSCASLPAPGGLIDVDDPELMLPGNILGKINAQLERSGQRRFARSDADVPWVANTIFHSLSARYAEVLSSIATLTKKKLRRLFIVGGGAQNTYLNRLTAERTGLEVIPGGTESSTAGNFAVQLAALEGQWSPEIGVDASAVAKWAEELALRSRVLSADRAAH